MNSHQFDFNIDNYSVDDIYKLFYLDIKTPLGISELKKAKHVMAMMHPDKSKLPKEYFLFFRKAFTVLVQISECNQTNRKQHKTDTYMGDDYYNAELHNYIITNKDEINATFNTRFEKINADILPEVQNGYGRWLKEKPDNNISLEDHPTFFSKYKEKHTYNPTENAVSILIPDSPQGNIGYSMLVDEPVEYSSGLFNPLQYTDLKKSYTNTLFDISSDTFSTTNKPQTIEQLSHIRKETVPPITVGESMSVFKARDNTERDISTHRAYVLCKQLEQSQVKNNLMTCDFFKIIN